MIVELIMASAKQQDTKLPESKEAQLKAYEKQVKDNINSMIDNFTEIIRQAKVCNLWKYIAVFNQLFTMYTRHVVFVFCMLFYLKTLE